MDLARLPRIKTKSKRRMGRGLGSGRGKTAGRGTKGQKARGKISLWFEGGALPLIKRLPKLRGRERNKPVRPKTLGINISKLSAFPKNTIIDKEALVKQKIVKPGKALSVKVLGKGEINVPLIVRLPTSLSVRKKIEKAGGRVET